MSGGEWVESHGQIAFVTELVCFCGQSVSLCHQHGVLREWSFSYIMQLHEKLGRNLRILFWWQEDWVQSGLKQTPCMEPCYSLHQYMQCATRSQLRPSLFPT